ncbi:MFS transporter [Saccharopolyspora rosea]
MAGRGTVALMSVATGVVIANVYYAQPLEEALAHGMGVPAGRIGVVLALFQIGFALGLATLVPLGDLVERRRLLAVLVTACVAGLIGLSAAPSLPVLAVSAVVVGMSSVIAQVLIPFAAHLAAPHEQGRVVSTVMSGLLIGVLVSRTAAGLIAEVAGWRAVFALGAAATALTGVLLHVALPRIEPTTALPYPELLASVLTLVREEPVLRMRMALGAAGFAAFSAFWSSAGFLLARPPYSWSNAAIGGFALIGVVGAVVARVAGRLADGGRARATTGAAFAVVALSFAVLQPGATSVVALAVGVATMDLGVQAAHITNQSVIYRLRPGANSRITTAYMTAYMLAGAVGSGLSSTLVFPRWGWTGVCALGGAFGVAGLLLWCVDSSRRRR